MASILLTIKWYIIYDANSNNKKAGVVILISDKRDFKTKGKLENILGWMEKNHNKTTGYNQR